MKPIFLALVMFSLPAHAADFQCSREEGAYAEKYFQLEGSEGGELIATDRALNAGTLPVFVEISGSDQAARAMVRTVIQSESSSSRKVYRQSRRTIARQFRFAAGAAPGQFDLVGENKILGKIAVSPVYGEESLGELTTASGKTYRCRFSEELVPGGELPADTAATLAAWQAFKTKQPRACSAANDAREIIQRDHAPVTVLLLQGYAVSPAVMMPIAEYFGHLGMNVLVPRLKGHYEVNPRELDTVKAEDWIKESEQAFQIAAKLSPKVMVVGYSLGGLLGARLALRYPQQVVGFIGLSPALRLSTKTSALSSIGSFLGLSANEALGGTVQTCHIYISSKGGLEVARVLSDTERRFGGSEADASASSFRRIKAPSLVFTVPDEDTVDNDGIMAAIPGGSKKHALVALTEGNHDSWGTAEWSSLKARRSPLSSSKRLTDHIAAFLKANGIN